MEGDTNGEGQSFSEGRFVKILAGGGIPPVPPTRGNTVAGHHGFGNEVETSSLGRLIGFDCGILKFGEKHSKQLWLSSKTSPFN